MKYLIGVLVLSTIALSSADESGYCFPKNGEKCPDASIPERTLILLKPDAVERGLVGRILQRFEERLFKIETLKLIHPSEALLTKHYIEHKERIFFNDLIKYMRSGPVVMIILSGNNVVTSVRKMIGATDASQALPEKSLCCESSKIAAFSSDDQGLSTMLTDYAWNEIVGSYSHLLLSVNFDSYTKDRPGFEKLYRGLSDHAWNKAIDLIKYVTKRGGKLHDIWDYNTQNITLHYLDPNVGDNKGYVSKPVEIETSVEELLSLEQAVKIEKSLSQSSYAIHNMVQSHHKLAKKHLDAGIAHYIEEEFIEDQADTIRKLVGYHNDFRTILGGEDHCTANKNTQLACFLFDEYLQKQ